MLKIQHEKQNSIDIVTLKGILNADTSSQLETLLENLTNQAAPKLLLHVPELSFISSAGIGCFIGVIKRIRDKGGDLRFSCMNAKVKRVFQLLDMEAFFQSTDSLEDGLISY